MFTRHFKVKHSGRGEQQHDWHNLPDALQMCHREHGENARGHHHIDHHGKVVWSSDKNAKTIWDDEPLKIVETKSGKVVQEFTDLHEAWMACAMARHVHRGERGANYHIEHRRRVVWSTDPYLPTLW